jgi:transposase
MSTPEVRLLVSLLRRLSSLQELLIAEKGRLSQPGLPKPVLQSLKHTIRFLEAEIERLRDQIDTHVENHPDLKADKDLITSVPGIGPATALWLLAEIGDYRQFASAQSVAAYAGLSPREYLSGSSVQKKTRISKTGNARLRKALYLPAMTATRYNPTIKAFYDRLVSDGKPKMVALAAAMRKLLMIVYGVLKSRTEFTLQPVRKAAKQPA